jgi:hypothetical protein
MIIDGRTTDGPDMPTNSNEDIKETIPSMPPTDLINNLDLVNCMNYHLSIVDDAKIMLEGDTIKDYPNLCDGYEGKIRVHSRYAEALKAIINGCFNN